ncbi:tryptophan--tRNA ligase [Clostridia bacterium]|nr:tryptophan--tRNA ligase [Clostridia bacterium]
MKKRVLSGIQPTSTPTLGNYLGAVKSWANMQEEYDAYYFIADLHALTVRQDPEKFRQQCLSSYALLLAMGIDTKKSVAFMQGQVPEHTELMWLLSGFAQFGELSRMTQFKDKSQKHADNVNAGLFTYPVLMAADILLYKAEYVPIGADQKQHLEITRDISERFNQIYGETLVTPEPFITEGTARIMSLADPGKKMSKSDENKNAVVSVLDPPDVIVKKFRRAVTDSEALVQFRPGDETKAGINNLISIYSGITGKTIQDTEKEFAGRGYGDFKTACGEAAADALAPVRADYERLMSDRDYLLREMKSGAEKAAAASAETIAAVREKIGLLPKNA